MATSNKDDMINDFNMEVGGVIRTDIHNVGDVIHRIEKIEKRLEHVEERQCTPEMLENNIVFGRGG